ncbi:DUF1345 domain-containing protein [Pseudonocardia sichuanensis]
MIYGAGLSVLAVILSWALVDTVFALKYARLYYKDETDADGGIDGGWAIRTWDTLLLEGHHQ